MKSKKSNGKGKQAGKRAINDLPVSDAKAKDAKAGGSLSGSLSHTVRSIGDGLAQVARKG
jgi:hypothetical protein